MKTTLDIPDELLAQLKARAVRDGRDVDQLAASLLAAGLRSDQGGGGCGAALDTPQIEGRPAEGGLAEPLISKDPDTGLPVIHSPPDAPIHSMTAEQFQAIVDEELLREDLERAGVSIRQ